MGSLSRARKPPGGHETVRAPPAVVSYVPGPWLYTHLTLTLGLGAFFAFVPRPIEWLQVLVGVALAVFGIVVFTRAWTRYDLDESALTRRTLFGTRTWSWRGVGGILGTEIQGGIQGHVGAGYDEQPPFPLGGDPLAHSVRYEVCDQGGHVLFRISPWTGRRKELAKEIRRRAKQAREHAAWDRAADGPSTG